MFAVAFSPKEQTIVSTKGKTIQLWDLKGNPLGKPIEVHAYAVYSVAFSPDGKYIVTSGADARVRLVSVEKKTISKTDKVMLGKLWIGSNKPRCLIPI